MGVYILRRLLINIPVLIGITLITFIAYNLAPGDPIDAMVDPSVVMDPVVLEARRKALGLDKPMMVRYGIWLSQALQGNLGYSYRSGEPVSERVGRRLPATLQLTVTALLIAIGLGIPLGVVSALRQYSRLDYTLTFFAFTGISTPNFWLALGAIYFFSLRLKLLPSHGMGDPDADFLVLERLRHLLLPALVLGLAGTASFLRYTRSSMLEVLSQDYMTTAKAKGLNPRAVLLRHGFRNALITIITVIGLSLPALVGGSIIVEHIFAWPGMGQLAISAINQRDYPILMGVALIASLVVLFSNLLTDVAYAIVDPRIRYGQDD
ncbi:MAG: ABC transporter permease [Caldilineaceae bacterium]|nr:ABC transporter permease [Caldilineaceae bacterium]